MNKTLSTTLIVITILALASGIFFAGNVYARANAYGPSMMFGNGWNKNNIYTPGMINEHGDYGMMGNNGNMMNKRGPSMMGGYGYNNVNVPPLTVDQAKAAAEKYLANLNNSDLKIAEVMIFDNNAYVVVKEISTGNGAFELLVDPASQTAYPEHGANMMWNLKYGSMNNGTMMGANSMMNGWNNQNQAPASVSTEMTVTPKQAIQSAQQYLDGNIAGATAATDPIQFYGYYTLDFEKNGKIAGMLSVNGYNGQIILHTWHGTFIEEAKQ